MEHHGLHLTVSFEADKDISKVSVVDVITRLEIGQYGYDTSEWGAKALATISYTAMMQKNTELITNFLDIGACERYTTNTINTTTTSTTSSSSSIFYHYHYHYNHYSSTTINESIA